jgi:hypothetical protein
MTEIPAVLALALAPDRSPEDRLASLWALSDYLHDQDVVLALAEAAPTERDTAVRKAMLAVLVSVDLTLLTRRDELLATIIAFSAQETEPELRLAATKRLAELAASSPAIQEVLAENLLCDLDEEIQRVCIAGIAACPAKLPSVVERLLVFARQAPRALRQELLHLYEQLERADFERGALAMLDPLEDEPLRRSAVDMLERLPSVSPAAVEPLIAYLEAEPLPDLRAQVVRVLSDGAKTTPGLLRAVLDDVRRTPDNAPLLYAFWGHLSSFPDAVPQLQELFASSGSARVKLYLLELLAGPGAIGLCSSALADPSPWVRYRAVQLCLEHGRAHGAAVEEALVERVPLEPVASLRAEMIGVLGALGSLQPGTGHFVLRWLQQETSPDAEAALAKVLPSVALTDDNRSDVLRSYLKVLRDPFFDEDLRTQVRERLSAFEYRDEPELKECLAELMEHATDLVEVERAYNHLRTLAPEAAPLMALQRKLFYRFVGSYPQAPLDSWLRELAGAPELRSEVPYLVRVSGATWVLENAEASAQKAALLPELLQAVRSGKRYEAEALLDEAYQSRTLRKSDAIALFRQLISYHDSYPVLDSLLRIFREVGIVNEEILDLCLSWLSWFPQAPVAQSVKEYLRAMGPAEPTWARRLDEAFCAETYERFHRVNASRQRRYPPVPHWDEPWRVPDEAETWAVADLFFSQASPPIAAKLDAPLPSAPALPHNSFHYLVLAKLDRRGSLDATELLSVGRLLHATAASPEFSLLHDRALFVLDRAWPSYVQSQVMPLGPELAHLAAETFVELCGRHQALGPGAPERDPAPLTGMDLDHCEALWTAGPQAWDALWERYAGYLDKPGPTDADDLAARLAAQSRQRPSPERRAGQPLAFRPLSGNVHDVLLDFAFRTPLGRGASWPARWKRMLQAAQWAPSFSRLLARLDGSERERILALAE